MLKKLILLLFCFLSFVLFSKNLFADDFNFEDSINKLSNSKDVYQSNNPDCKGVAEIAALIVAMKNRGITYKQTNIFIKEYSKQKGLDSSSPIEISRQIYKDPEMKNLTESGAYSTYGAGCDFYMSKNN